MSVFIHKNHNGDIYFVEQIKCRRGICMSKQKTDVMAHDTLYMVFLIVFLTALFLLGVSMA